MERDARATEPVSLKRCPFCGAKGVVRLVAPAHVHHFVPLPPAGDTWTCECSGCEAGFCAGTEADVIAAWNRRPPADGGNVGRLTALRDLFKYWLDWNAVERARENLITEPDTNVMQVPPPHWPTRDSLQRWVDTLNDAIARLSPEPRDERLEQWFTKHFYDPAPEHSLVCETAKDAAAQFERDFSQVAPRGDLDLYVVSRGGAELCGPDVNLGPSEMLMRLVRRGSSTTKEAKPLDMSRQPMGDPHPLDLAKNGQCVYCGARDGGWHDHGCPSLNGPERT